MRCVVCGGKTRVNTSGMKGSKVRRYRECTDCLTRFVTFEEINYKSLPDYIRKKVKK